MTGMRQASSQRARTTHKLEELSKAKEDWEELLITSH